MSETDLVISLGARFDDRVTGKLSEFAKYADIIHVDIDAANIGKLVDVDYPIVGDVTEVLTVMLPLLDGINTDRYQAWRDILKRYDELHPQSYVDSDEVIKPQWAIERINLSVKMRSSHQMLDSTRCGLHSTIRLTDHVNGSIQVVWERWDLVFQLH